jgi:hypothetical protein
MLRLTILLALALVVAGCERKPTTQTTAPQGTLTATVTETVTTTKTIPCVTVTKNEASVPPSYICTPEAPPACTTDCPPPTGGGGDGLPAITCPAGSMVINGQWGNTAITTADYGAFNQQWLAVEVKVPSSWSSSGIKTSSWGEYQDGGAARTAMFATQPCTFDTRYAMKVKGGTGGNAYSTDSISVGFKYTLAPSENYAVTVTPGTTYWINIKNVYSDGSSSCNGSCGMRGGLPQ